jgi:hypothetical protein
LTRKNTCVGQMQYMERTMMHKLVHNITNDLTDLKHRMIAERRIAVAEINPFAVLAMDDMLGKVDEMLAYIAQEELYESSDDLNRQFREATGKDMF